MSIFIVMDSPMPRPSSLQAHDENLGQRPSGTPMFPQPLINRPGTRGSPSPGRSNPRPQNIERINAMYTDPDDDNHANQCNPNNDEYWHSRE